MKQRCTSTLYFVLFIGIFLSGILKLDSYNKPLNKNRSYEYDALSQLVSFTENGAATQYVYDSLGNLTKETADGQATVYTYNNLNQLTTKTTPASVFAYRYDRRGNLTGETKDGSPYKSYVYDAANHMVKGFREDSGEESRYVFNGLGKRVRMEPLTANPDIHYQNNTNTGGNGYDEIVEYLFMLGLSEATGKTYSNNYGLTIQQSEASTLTLFKLPGTPYTFDAMCNYSHSICHTNMLTFALIYPTASYTN